MRNKIREKQRASQEYQAHCAPNPKEKTTGNLPSRIANSITKKNSYGLGCTTIDRETAEINPFPICKRNKTSNTKGYRNIPYSRWLK